jgi:hypothetical protein
MICFITIFELETKTVPELRHLHRLYSRLLMATDAHSAERRNILATLENIETVLHAHWQLPHFDP